MATKSENPYTRAANEFRQSFLVVGAFADIAIFFAETPGVRLVGGLLHVGLVVLAIRRAKQQRLPGAETAVWSALAMFSGLWLIPLFGLGQAVPPKPEATMSAGSAPSDEALGQLERLARLHVSGALTDEQFAAKRAELLDRI